MKAIIAPGIVMLLEVGAAHAQAVPVTLSYDAPEDCPSASQVLAEISQRVRRLPAEPVVAEAKITAFSAWYALDLKLEGGRRHVTSETCEALADTLVVILALAVDPRANVPVAVGRLDVAAEGPGASTLAPFAEGKASIEPSALVPPTRAPVFPIMNTSVTVSGVLRVPGADASKQSPAPRGIRLSPMLLAWLELGMLPSPSYGPALGASIARERWSLALLAEWLAPQWVRLSDDSASGGGNISFLGGQFIGCLVPVASRWLETCAGVESGDLMGKGTGTKASNGLGHGLWLAGAAAVLLRLPVADGVGVKLGVGLAVPVRRPAFGFAGSQLRFEPSSSSLRLLAGIDWL